MVFPAVGWRLDRNANRSQPHLFADGILRKLNRTRLQRVALPVGKRVGDEEMDWNCGGCSLVSASLQLQTISCPAMEPLDSLSSIWNYHFPVIIGIFSKPPLTPALSPPRGEGEESRRTNLPIALANWYHRSEDDALVRLLHLLPQQLSTDGSLRWENCGYINWGTAPFSIQRNCVRIPLESLRANK
jgi:hypothetical protein